MPFSVQIVPTGLAELKSIPIFDRRRIVQAIDEQLTNTPTTPTRNRKLLIDPRTPVFGDQPAG